MNVDIKKYQRLHKNIIKNGGEPDFEPDEVEERLAAAQVEAQRLIDEGYVRTSSKYHLLTKLPEGEATGGTHIEVDRFTFDAFRQLGGHSLSEHLAIPGLHRDINEVMTLLVRHGVPIRVLSYDELKNISVHNLCMIKLWLEDPRKVAMPKELKL